MICNSGRSNTDRRMTFRSTIYLIICVYIYFYMYVCMYVCIYVCMYVCMFVSIDLICSSLAIGDESRGEQVCCVYCFTGFWTLAWFNEI